MSTSLGSRADSDVAQVAPSTEQAATSLPPSPEYRNYLRRRRRSLTAVVGTQLLVLLAAVALWQIGGDLKWWDPLLTSTPSTVWRTFWHLSSEGILWTNTAVTLQETLISFAVAMVAGIVIATLIWWSPFLSRVLDPYLVVLNAMPKTALGPIFIIWLGSDLSIYGMAISISLIVTILTVTTGFNGVDPNKVKLMRTLGANNGQILRKVIYPASLPTIVSAVKVNIGLTLVGVIVGEFLSAKAGLGYLILYGGQVFDMSMVMTAIVVLILMSAVLYAIVVGVESLVRRRSRALE
jgi:NitT/TauT family transport system permease protein